MLQPQRIPFDTRWTVGSDVYCIYSAHDRDITSSYRGDFFFFAGISPIPDDGADDDDLGGPRGATTP